MSPTGSSGTGWGSLMLDGASLRASLPMYLADTAGPEALLPTDRNLDLATSVNATHDAFAVLKEQPAIRACGFRCSVCLGHVAFAAVRLNSRGPEKSASPIPK